jgi:hypothetical protein
MAHAAELGRLDRRHLRPGRNFARCPRHHIWPRNASLAGFVWAFKLVRHAPALARLQQVISDSRHALLSVLLGSGIVMLVAASLAYLLERGTQPRVFGSIPAALWWAIVTLTTTGYGDVVPMTAPGRCWPVSSWSAASSSSHCGPAFSRPALPKKRQLLGHQPDLARIIHEEADRRLAAG